MALASARGSPDRGRGDDREAEARERPEGEAQPA
jgi:hypothetical protein